MNVNARYLKGLLRLAAKQDIRYYLNGIFVEATKDAGKFYVATDGHRMGVFHEGWGGDEPEDTTLIIPRDVLEQARLLKLNGPAKLPTATLTREATGTLWTLNTHEGARLTFTPIDGKFPEWRKAIPKSTDGGVGSYDWQLMYGFYECMADINGGARNLILTQNGSEPALVTHPSEDFVGVLMPMKMSDSKKLPAWARAPEEAVVA